MFLRGLIPFLILLLVLPSVAFTVGRGVSPRSGLVARSRRSIEQALSRSRISVLQSTKIPSPPSPERKEKRKVVRIKKREPVEESVGADAEYMNGEKADEALRLMSSELGVRRALGREIEPSFPLHLLIERTLDTVEDVVLHLRRIPYDLGWVPETMDTNRQTIVILGSGWAAHALMKVADSFLFRVIVVSPSNHFVFTPMLASAAVGTVEYRSMTEAVRSANPMMEYVEGAAKDVNLDKRVIKVQLNSLLDDIAEGEAPLVDINYDKLVVATGVRVADSFIPGAKDRCLRLKSVEDARRLRASLGECFEYASRPDVLGRTDDKMRNERRRRVTVLIIGGGPTGVELAGEISDFAEDITRPRVGAYPSLKDDVRVVLVHGGAQLVPQFEEDLRDEALRALVRRGIEVKLNTRVVEVGDKEVVLRVKQFDANGNQIGAQDEILPCGLKIFAAGTSSVPFVDTLLNKLPESARGVSGKINVDRWMRVQTDKRDTFGSLLVLGDAAAFKGADDSLLPQTAQVAGQQGAYAARLLCRGYDLSATQPQIPCYPWSNVTDVRRDLRMRSRWLSLRGLDSAPSFQFLNLGLLAYLGGGEALTQVQLGDVPVFSYAGSVAFVLWRSVYLVKQVASRNRILITFDWIKSAIFGRDVTRL